MARVFGAARIEVQLSVGVWTDITPDVLTELGIHADRGARGNGPLDRTADPGSLTFSLRNDRANSGKTRSWYSPNHVSARSGWTEGIAIRLVWRYQGTDYPLWRGKIKTINPTAGDAPQRAEVFAHDSIAEMSDATVREIAPQIDKSEVELQQAVIAALPTDARPVATSYDTALDEYPFAYDNVGGGASALGLVNDAVVSALGSAFIAGDGTYTSVNRHSEALADSVLTLVDEDLLVRGPGFTAPSSLANVFNRVRVTIHPKDEVAGTVLFASTTATQIQPGQTIELWDTYADPDNRSRLIGARSFTALVAGTDYSANSAEDGSGADLTSSLSIAITTFVTTAKSELTNTGPSALFVTMRQLRGTGIFDNGPITLESYVPQPYGDRPLPVDLPFQADPLVAQDIADYLAAQFSDRTRQGDELVWDPHRSHTLMLGALTTEICDVVTATEHQTGLSAVEFSVRGIAYEIEGGPYGFALTMRYRVAPHLAGSLFVFDDPVSGVLDADAAVLGYA